MRILPHPAGSFLAPLQTCRVCLGSEALGAYSGLRLLAVRDTGHHAVRHLRQQLLHGIFLANDNYTNIPCLGMVTGLIGAGRTYA
jgi:hypothetical protein